MGERRKREFGDLTVRIERDICIGSENCVSLAPEVFRLDDEQIVDFVDTEAPDVERERLIEACDLCPVDALVVIDETGTRVVP